MIIARLAFLALLAGTGCGTGKTPSQEQASLRGLAIQYGRFVAKHEGMGPSGPEEFKEFIKQNSAVPVDEVEKLFVSSRDKQPYVIVYNLRVDAPDAKGGPAIAYEKVGVNGKRLVALPTTKVEEVDDERFAELVSKNP